MNISRVTKSGSNMIDIDMDNEIEIDDDPILGNMEENEPQKKRSKAKNSSFVWDHFTKKTKPKVLPTNYKDKATCNYCGTEFTCNSDNNGTSSMRTHLVKRCKEYELSDWYVKKHGGDKRQKTLGFEPVVVGDTAPKLTATSFSAEACRKALVEMIIIDELPFRFVEGQGFRRFMHVVQPKWTKIPSRVTVARDCLQLFKDGKQALKKVFKNQRVCLTTDTWTSLQNLNYMCLTAHFIDDDWKLHKKIINFCLVPNHKGETLGKEVERCLVGWGIDKILTLTIDNASSNNGIIDYLKKKTMKRDSTILDHEFLHVRCCAHILNLVVREGLKEVDVSIARVRNIVRYVRSSPQRYRKFRECVERDQIVSKLVPCLVVEIKEGMKRVYNWYEKRRIEQGIYVDEFRNKEKNATRVMDLSEALDSEFDQHMEEETNMVSKSELERYWLEAMEDRKNEKFDLLTWWSTNCSRYHILSQMARDILAIPVSTVASESAFSTGGRILDPYRTSLSPKMAETLICAQNWLRYPCEISLRDQLDEIEELESVVSEAFEDSCVTEL